ncbi:DeoR/GlpR family DNA-binding transcription regulator [Rhizobium sp. Root1220]|uniref:DeoR/GlpR family DNA-binding transcription regulator n=1 Tax=Rhizobium sp. Root1220 TaxID=1736432 RepID=UPI0012E3F246|nr:DeoR/GlpR family DNA-binding transcription regulator [Rhizobium sp. Root1220]
MNADKTGMNVNELLLQERQSAISRKLQANGRVLAAELAVEFGVSEDTVRRDLREMAAAGLCERVYGGALPFSSASGSLSHRVGVARDRKQALAMAAVSQIAVGSTVFFDAGSTNLAIAAAFPTDMALTAITNAPAIAAALIDKPAVNVILIGGLVDRQVGGSLGAKAMRDMEMLSPDLCILGACGIDLVAGVTTLGFEDAEFKRFATSRSRKVLVAVTSEKFGTAAPHAVLPMAQCECLVVERDADAGMLAQYRDRGCRTIVAGEAA